jgi:hypothetical protein
MRDDTRRAKLTPEGQNMERAVMPMLLMIVYDAAQIWQLNARRERSHLRSPHAVIKKQQ